MDHPVPLIPVTHLENGMHIQYFCFDLDSASQRAVIELPEVSSAPYARLRRGHRDHGQT